MPQNSRYYYKRYLEEAVSHLEIVHDRLTSAFSMTDSERYMDHQVFLQTMDKALYEMRETLLDYIRKV